MTNRQVRSKALGKAESTNNPRTSKPDQTETIRCYNCCKNGHYASKCRSESFCPFCKIKGHCLRDCRKKKAANNKTTNKNNNTNNNNIRNNNHNINNKNNNNSNNNGRNNKKDNNNDRNSLNNSNNRNNQNINNNNNRSRSSNTNANNSNGSNNPPLRNRTSTRNVNPICKFCKKRNHKESDCWFKKDDNKSNNNNARDYQHTSCKKCGNKGHLAKDCRTVNSNKTTKHWPLKRVCKENDSQLSNEFNWSSETIASWTEYIRLKEFQVFYDVQIESLSLDIDNWPTKPKTFSHLFDNSTVDLIIPDNSLEFKKAKLAEFKKGKIKIIQLVEDNKNDFLKQVNLKCEQIMSGDQHSNDPLSLLATTLADSVRASSIKKTPPESNKELLSEKVKEICKYVQNKLMEVNLQFECGQKEATSEAQMKFAIKKSRQETKALGNINQNRVDADLNAIVNAVTEVNSPTPSPAGPPSPAGHVARSVASRHASQANNAKH